MSIRITLTTDISRYESIKGAQTLEDYIFLSSIPFWHESKKYPVYVLFTGIELKQRLRNINRHMERFDKSFNEIIGERK